MAEFLMPTLTMWISEFNSILIHRVCSRTARTEQRNSVFKNKTKNKQKTLVSTQSFQLLMIICLFYLLCCVYLSQTPVFQQSSRLSLLGDYDHRSILLYLVQLCLLHICFEFKFLLFDSLLFTTGSIIAIAVLISKVSPLCILYTVIVLLYTLNYEMHYRT